MAYERVRAALGHVLGDLEHFGTADHPAHACEIEDIDQAGACNGEPQARHLHAIPGTASRRAVPIPPRTPAATQAHRDEQPACDPDEHRALQLERDDQHSQRFTRARASRL